MAHPSELQVQIDDVHACPGHCGGCVLAASERRARGPDMDEATRDLIITRLIAYVRERPRLDRLNLTFGIADHLLMPDDYLARLFAQGIEVIRAAAPRDPAHSAVFFTTALIGRRARLMPRLEWLAGMAVRAGVDFIPVAVLDPALLYNRNFGSVYEGMILETRALFGKVDLSINLSDEAVRTVSPGMLHDFAAENGFDELTINLVPTLENRHRTLADSAYMAWWLLEFDRRLGERARISSSFRPVLWRSIDAVRRHAQGSGAAGYGAIARDLVPETVRRSLQFDSRGHLMPKFEAIGDIPHNPRFGYEHLGHVGEGSITELLDRAIPEIQRRVVAGHARMRACAGCEHAAVCAGTGFHVFNHVLPRQAGREGCPHMARALFDHFVPLAGAAEPPPREVA